MNLSEEIRSFLIGLGADQFGIAGIDRFTDTPKGFKPNDIWSACKSVVVFLKRLPSEVILAENPVIYTHTAHIIYDTLDHICLNLCRQLEKLNIHAVPVPTDDPYLYWDPANKHGMGILSLRHAAFNAGLGILGKNTLLINREFGNMVYIGAVLIDAEVDPDPIVDDFSCPPNCSQCLDACPVQALDGITVIQKRCREKSYIRHERGWNIYKCCECRKVCLYRTGMK